MVRKKPPLLGEVAEHSEVGGVIGGSANPSVSLFG